MPPKSKNSGKPAPKPQSASTEAPTINFTGSGGAGTAHLEFTIDPTVPIGERVMWSFLRRVLAPGIYSIIPPGTPGFSPAGYAVGQNPAMSGSFDEVGLLPGEYTYEFYCTYGQLETLPYISIVAPDPVASVTLTVS